MWDTFKNLVKGFFNVRLLPVAVIFVLLFSLLINRMFELQIVDSASIIENGSSSDTKTRTIKATRGNIYDRNGNLLAYNKLSYNVTYEDTTKVSAMTNEEKNAMIYQMIRLIEKNGGKLAVEFYLELDDQGEPYYTVEGNTLLRFIAEVYGTTLQKLTQKQQDTSARQLYDFLRKDTSSSSPKFEIDENTYDDATTLKIMAIRYAMFINRFTKYQQITIAKDVDEVTVAAIQENSAQLPGVDISHDTVRVYKKSKYFAHILGYTGSVSSEKVEELKADTGKTDYTTDDQIGISGLESTYEEYLKGTKGTQTLTINEGTSRIESVTDDAEPVAGNDLYLTLDADLQEECYNILEEHIAGILVSNINNSADAGTRGQFTKNIKVPIYDVYNALLENNVVDTTRFTDDDASSLEKRTYRKYKQCKKSIINRMKKLLATNSKVTKKQLSDDMQEFLDCFYSALKDNGIVITKSIDTNDDVYRKYNNGHISLSEYLQYAISAKWVELDKLNIGNNYYSAEEIYQKLVRDGLKLLENDSVFDKMIYSYLVYHYQISGKDCCLLLFDQGDIKYNENEYNQLSAGTLSPYTFLINKIRKLVITPGQLGLDPCSGSLVVTDVKTGEVRAMVSYPSYDNNKMANQVDSEYFYKYLSQNTASPLINRPTQVELAPGSTFKIVSSVAALEEGILSPGTQVYDHVTFDKVYGNPHCWSSVSHGNLTVATAIEVSCNYFFYNVGYKLSGLTSTRNVNNSRGLARLKKYAKMFGLTDKSGVEVQESTPQFSTEDAVRSAIGQGNHAYAPIQLSRYVSTVANNGTCYNLTLIDKIKDVKGKVVLNNSAKVRNKVAISGSTWDAIHRGMYLVVNGSRSEISSMFKNLNKTVAGKTGTAQQNTQHPNHAYFISYAPYENPKVSVTCVIPNGYASSNAANTASDVYKYYFSGKKKRVSKGKASLPVSNRVTD